jgi:hypothetical protein
VQLTSIKELQGHLKFNCISGKGGLSQKGSFYRLPPSTALRFPPAAKPIDLLHLILPDGVADRVFFSAALERQGRNLSCTDRRRQNS